MKNNIIKHAIFQSFLFNTVIVGTFITIWLYYIYPQYIVVKEKKSEFSKIYKKYKTLVEQGMTFDEFNQFHKWTKSKNPLLDNILIDFREDDYKQHFTHTWSVYKTFLAAKILDAKEKRKQQEVTNINFKIKEILPEYTSNSSLSDNSLTDFKFVNHIERLLDRFELSTKDKIWIWNLSEVWGQKSKKWEKQIKQNPLDGTIYEWFLQLGLIWEKKNIINFIHYIENVWKINVVDKKVSILEMDTTRILIGDNWKRKKNNFLDMNLDFKKEGNIYDELLMEVESLEFSDYLDSSDLPTPDNYTLIQLIKETQGKEKFEINIKLKYYVKGLPTFKIEKFIAAIQKRHTELLKISASWFAYVSKNRSKLKGSKAISTISSLNKINRYLIGIKQEIDLIKVWLAKKENIWELYKTAQEFNTVFKIITEKLSADIEAVSVKLYKQHKEVLDKNNK